MGLALLPLERLHPYILGSLLFALNLWRFFSEDTHSFSSWGWEAVGFASGVVVMWLQHRKDSAPTQERDKHHTHKDIRLGED